MSEDAKLYKVIEDKAKNLFPKNTFSYDLGVADACKFAKEQIDLANTDFPDENDTHFRDCSSKPSVIDWMKFSTAVKEWHKKWFGEKL